MCPVPSFYGRRKDSACYCLSSPGPIFIIIIWLFISLLSSLSSLSLIISLNLDFNPTYVSTSSFLAAARSCCYYYCLWSPGPIFIIIIWLFTLYSHLSHLSFNQFHWIWILIQLMCPLHLFWPPQRSCCYYYCLWSPGPIFIIIIWLFTLYSHLSHLSFNNSIEFGF